MALTTANIEKELKNELKNTVQKVMEKDHLQKLSLNDLIFKMHEHFKATYLAE